MTFTLDELTIDRLNSYGDGSTAGSYTAEGGETLQQIAQRLYGDAGLWYKIAEANGMSAGSTLAAGQQLVLPGSVIRNTHSADSYRPYDPANAIGDLSPTAPKPNKGNKCGFVGMLLIAAIAIAVTALTAGAAVSIIAPNMSFASGLSTVLGTSVLGGSVTAGGVAGALGTAGTIGVGAAAGAASSVASQGAAIAMGMQDKFSFKGVALAALSGAVGAGLGPGGLAGEKGLFGNSILAGSLRSSTGSALTQGIAVATGLQSKFDWAAVAAAGIGGAAGGFASRLAGGVGGLVLGSGASLIAGAATRSAINGSSFGDNIRAALPDVIAQVLGAVLTGALAPKRQADADITETSTASSKPTAGEAVAEQMNVIATGLDRYNVEHAGYADYFPYVTAALLDHDMQTGGAEYAVAQQHQRIVRNLAAQHSAMTSTSSDGYASLDALDGKKDGIPTVGGWAASEFELRLRDVSWAAAYTAGEVDANVYAGIKDSLAVNARLIDDWNTIADGEINKLLFVGLGAPMLIAGGMVAAPAAAGYAGSFYISGSAASTIASSSAGFATGGAFGAGFEFTKNEALDLKHTAGGYTTAILGGGLGGSGLRLLPNTVLSRAVSDRAQTVALGAFSGGVADISGQLVTNDGDYLRINYGQTVLATGLGGGLGAVTPLNVRINGFTAGRNSDLSVYQGLSTRMNNGNITRMQLRYPVTAGAANAVLGSGQQGVGIVVDGVKQRAGR